MTTLGVGGAAPRARALRETDPHVLFFTSGSTGRPKGVLLSHRASYLRGFQGVFRDVPERSVCMFPLFHMAGFTLAIAAWQTRGEIALVESASAEQLLGAVERRRANRLYAIPAVWARVLETEPGKMTPVASSNIVAHSSVGTRSTISPSVETAFFSAPFGLTSQRFSLPL